MTPTPYKWDIFLSYASEERAWVVANLYEPLLRCWTGDGRRPEVFMDITDHGLEAGQAWLDALSDAIQYSRKAVLIYSSRYFQKKMTGWELTKFIERDADGAARVINPILIDPAAADKVPFKVSHIHYLRLTMPDWFPRLCRALELATVPVEARTRLQLLDEPPERIVVNLTLPPLRVAVVNEQGQPGRDEEITLVAREGRLQGTLTVRSHNGVARFEDLSFAVATPATSLVASAKGHETITSRALAVVEPPPPPPPTEAAPELRPETKPSSRPGRSILGRGEVVFFGNGQALAVLTPERATIHHRSGRCLAQAPLGGPVRLVRRADALLVLAEWSGKVHLFADDGQHCCWDFSDAAAGFTVPGDVAIVADVAYVGFWNGAVYQLAMNKPAVSELVHLPGVQALAVAGGCLCIAGLDVALHVYQNGQSVAKHQLETRIWMLKAIPGGVIAAGEEFLYKLSLNATRVLKEPLPLAGVAAVLQDGDRPVIIDSSGQGGRFHPDLVIRSRFHTTAGAVPVSMDQKGRYCVFRNPDGSRTLLVDERIVFTHRAGTLAVAPAGDLLALGDEQGLRLVRPSALSL